MSDEEEAKLSLGINSRPYCLTAAYLVIDCC